MRRLAPIVLSLCSTVLTVGVLEIAARIWADPSEGYADIIAMTGEARTASVLMKSADPELLYVTRPNYVRDGVRISEAHGVLRPDDVQVVKPRDTLRIAVIGDSIAAGHPLRMGDTMPFALQLEDRLEGAAGASRVEVLTFAADGYSTLQEARLLETEVAPFSPDIVIVAYCLNDPSSSYTPTVWFLDDPAPRSYLLDFMRRRLGLTPSELSPAHPRYTHSTIDWSELYRRDGAAWESVEQGLTRIEAFTRQRHLPVLFVLFPLLTGDEPPAEQVHHIYDQVREAAERRAFHLLDLHETYRHYKAAELRFLPDDPIHPGALGHSLAAGAIQAALELDNR